MNVGDPNGTVLVQLLPRESDMPVVVKIPEKVKAEERRGITVKKVLKKKIYTKIHS